MTALYLKKIALRQFRSFASVDVELPPEPGVLIVHGSNGLGKSSLFDALEWTLSDRIDHFRDANGVKKPGKYLCRWRKGDAGPTSARITFSDESSIERTLSSAKANKSKLVSNVDDITAFLRAPDWQQGISDIQRYLLLTHFLGQSTLSRLTYRKSTERFDILKEAAQSTSIEAIANSLHGQGNTKASLAYGKWVDALEREATTVEDLLEQEADLWEQAQLAGALDEAAAAAEGRRIGNLLKAAQLQGFSAAAAEVDLSDPTIEGIQVLADRTGRDCFTAEARLEEARRLYDELKRNQGKLSEIAGAQEYVRTRQAELVVEIEPAQQLRDDRADSVIVRQQSAAEGAKAVSRLRGLRDTRISLAKREGDHANSLRALDVVKGAKLAAEHKLAKAERKRQILNRLGAEVRLLDEEAARIREVVGTLDQAIELESRILKVTDDLAALEEGFPNVQEEVLRAQAESAAAESSFNAQSAMVLVTRTTVDAMSGAISSIATNLPDDACDCPVCATHFDQPSDLQTRVASAAQRLAPLLVEQEERLAGAKATRDALAARVETLRAGLSSIALSRAELAIVKNSYTEVLGKLDTGEGAPAEALADRRLSAIVRISALTTRRQRKLRWQRHASLTSQNAQDEHSNAMRVHDAAQRELDAAVRRVAAASSAVEGAKADEAAASALVDGGAQIDDDALKQRLEQAEAELRGFQVQVEDAARALMEADVAVVALRAEYDGLQVRLEQHDTEKTEISLSQARINERWLAFGYFGPVPALEPVKAFEQSIATARLAVKEAVEGLSRLREGRLIWERQRSQRAVLDQIRVLIDAPPSWTRDQILSGAATLREQKHGQAKAILEIKEIAKAASADINAELEDFNAAYIKPLGFLMKRINQAILCDPRIGIDLHVKKKKIEQSAVKDGDVPKAIGDIDPRLVHSEGQMAALAVSMLCAASLTFPWSRWRSLVLDDPLQHNDSIHAAAFADLMANLVQRKGYQVLLSTHDIAQAEFLQRKFRSRRIPCTTLNLLGLGKDGVEWAVQPAFPERFRAASA